MQQDLHERIKFLEQSFEDLSGQFGQAFKYSNSDPQASLNKVRIILEKILKQVYAFEVGEAPDELMIGAVLNNPLIKKSIEGRIYSKIHAIRSMANLAVHGKYVTEKDALNSMDNLCDVMEWYIDKYEKDHVRAAKKKNRPKIKKVLFFLIPLFLIAIIASFAYHQSLLTEVKYEAPKPSDTDIAEFVHEFEESINKDNLDHILQFYADEVIYYGKRVSKKPYILHDKKAFIDRWSARNYFVSTPIQIIQSDSRVSEVEYEVSFYATNNANKKKSVGTWAVNLKVRQKPDKGFEIIEINGKEK